LRLVLRTFLPDERFSFSRVPFFLRPNFRWDSSRACRLSRSEQVLKAPTSKPSRVLLPLFVTFSLYPSFFLDLPHIIILNALQLDLFFPDTSERVFPQAPFPGPPGFSIQQIAGYCPPVTLQPPSWICFQSSTVHPLQTLCVPSPFPLGSMNVRPFAPTLETFSGAFSPF